MKTSPNIEERIVIVIFSNDNRCNNAIIFGNLISKANIMDILIIDNGESYQITCTRILGSIFAYVMRHDFKVLGNVVKLHKLVSEITQRYRGWSVV